MSKYFKNNKSDGDEENKSVSKSGVKPRSYSCKPDIGPSGDHKPIERLPFETRPNLRVNMWLNNVGSGSSRTSQSNSELYTIDEDHLEKINFIRRRLDMAELNDPEELHRTEVDLRREEPGRNKSDQLACPLKEECTICRRCREEKLNIRPSLSSISEKSNISNASTQSAVRYKPPPKKICLKAATSTETASINSRKTDCAKTDVIEIPGLDLGNDQEQLSNENKSVQCTSKDTERTSQSTDYWKPKCVRHDDAGDNIDLVEVDLYIEPEIVVKQPGKPTGLSSKNCIKFLPIRDDEVTTSGKSNKNEFFDEIVSNCSFSLGQLSAPLVPSHDSFFKSKKKQKKRRLKKRGFSVVEGVKLDKSSIEIRRTFPDTSETSDALEEIETDEISGINSDTDAKTFDSKLMASLAIPSKIVKPVKLPLVAKLTEMMKGGRCKKSKDVEHRSCMFEDDICSVKNVQRQNDTYVRAGAEFNNYREAAEELLTINETKKVKEDGCHQRSQKIPNKYSTKKRQSVDYEFYSEGLPQSRTCEVLHLSHQQQVEDDSDSECLRAIENCCCIRRIFKKKTPTFFSN
ncbi:uncharacterized protein LOC123314811 [Coccinella septempunctata]|uniref:uncharacterized protein LOC123314811 n=1 Tax=Coccinella septempunctata TaxID=41139 RepID=UPI001D0625A4|nr:uncharacterized protein LOC123314811 [Coccinella septempunctata]